MRLWPFAVIALTFIPLFVLLSLPGPVHATGWNESGISIYDMKDKLGQAFGFTGASALEVGGWLLGLIIMAMLMLPAIFLIKRSNAAFMYVIIMGMASIGVNIAMALFPWWILLVTAMLVGILLAGNVRAWITGRAGE